MSEVGALSIVESLLGVVVDVGAAVHVLGIPGGRVGVIGAVVGAVSGANACVTDDGLSE